MGWTKRELISEAFTEIAIAGYEFDISPEEQGTALRRLDTMMATWEARGISLGYPMPSSPSASDPDQDSGLPDKAVEPVFLALAIRIAGGFGKTMPADTRKLAREGYENLLLDAAQPIQQQLPSTLPLGAGNKPWAGSARVFFPTPCIDQATVDGDDNLTFTPE